MDREEAAEHMVGIAQYYLKYSQAEKAMALLDGAAALTGPTRNIMALRCDALSEMGRQEDANALAEHLQRNAPPKWQKKLTHMKIMLLMRLNRRREAGEQLQRLKMFEREDAKRLEGMEV